MNAHHLFPVAFNMRRIEKNSLIAVFDLELPSGMVLRGCMLHRSHGKHWVGLPGRPYKGSAGKESWAHIIDFRNRLRRDRFQSLAVDAALSVYRLGRQEAS